MKSLVSGSPIVQNGRLIGAVTHVLVNDPTMRRGTESHPREFPGMALFDPVK